MELKSKQEIRSQIAIRGKRNDLKLADDEILNEWLNTRGLKSHVHFIRSNHTTIKMYDEARKDVLATTEVLAEAKTLYKKGDQLYDYLYENFVEFACTNSPTVRDRIKGILIFVRYPEHRMDYSKYGLSYDELLAKAKYKTTKEYPKLYIEQMMLPRCFDVKLTNDEKDQEAFDYGYKWLSTQKYDTDINKGHQFVTSVQETLDYIIDEVRKDKGLCQQIHQVVIEKDMSHREGRINNSQSGLGIKNSEWFIKVWTTGLDPKAWDYLVGRIDVYNRLYNDKLEYPPMRENGLKLHQLAVQFIIQEDPLQKRYAFESNPLEDAIAYAGMDITSWTMTKCSWIKVGHKRTTMEDYIKDKSTWTTLASMRAEAIAVSEHQISTDLSKATENLPVYNIKAMMAYVITGILGGYQKEVTQWCEDTYNGLSECPVTLSTKGLKIITYPKRGNTQGMPGSYHTMTLMLAVTGLQACKNATAYPVQKLVKMIAQSGDDGVLLERAKKEYMRLLAITCDIQDVSEVFNDAKSFSSSINNSIEFCQVMYYHENPELIVGYRRSSAYKVVSELSGLASMYNDCYKHDRHIYKEYVESFRHSIISEDKEVIEAAHKILTDSKYMQRIIKLNEINTLMKIKSAIVKYGNQPLYRADVWNVIPESWRRFAPHKRPIHMDKETGLVTLIDIQLMAEWFEPGTGIDKIVAKLINASDELYNSFLQTPLVKELYTTVQQVQTNSQSLKKTYKKGMLEVMPIPGNLQQLLGEGMLIVAKDRFTCDMLQRKVDIIMTEGDEGNKTIYHKCLNFDSDVLSENQDMSTILQENLRLNKINNIKMRRKRYEELTSLEKLMKAAESASDMDIAENNQDDDTDFDW